MKECNFQKENFQSNQTQCLYHLYILTLEADYAA